MKSNINININSININSNSNSTNKKQNNSLSNGLSFIHTTTHSISHHHHPKMDKITQNNLKKIQQHVSTFYSNPQCNGYCQCQICKENYEISDKGKQFLRQNSSLIKIDTERIKTFYKFMASSSSSRKKISFRLNIPTICFFQKGECKELFKSKNQYITLQDNHQNNKRNIANLFVQANKKKADSHINLSKNKDNHIRHFSAIVPSYIHGTNEENQQMKQAKTYFFHKDRNLENDNIQIVEKNVSEQVAILKYLDNKGYQLLNEKQLRHLLKSPVTTASIDFIQSYIRPHLTESEFMFTQYHGYNAPQNPLMWSRSSAQVKIEINLITKYSKQYIPIQQLQSYEQVLKQIPDQYILYQTYKIIHYMNLVKDIQINTITTVWLKDQYRQICFFGILNFEYEQNQKIQNGLNQIYSVKQMMNKPFNDLEKQLMSVWQKVKKSKLSHLEDIKK